MKKKTIIKWSIQKDVIVEQYFFSLIKEKTKNWFNSDSGVFLFAASKNQSNEYRINKKYCKIQQEQREKQ